MEMADMFPATEPKLVYEPLPTPQSIRLLVLVPGHYGDPIRSRLIFSTVEDTEMPYHALSYVWGETTSVRSIECNERRVGVTDNLYSALSRIRSTEFLVPIWVDALCINQSSDPVWLAERSHQVQMMAKIFSRATITLIDLKDPIPDPLSFLNFLESFRQNGGEHPHLLPSLQDPQWKTLWHVLDRPWFSRIWTIQEFVLAKKPQLMLYTTKVPGREFFSSALLACRHFNRSCMPLAQHLPLITIQSSIRGARTLSVFQRSWVSQENHSLQGFFSNIFRSFLFGATDQRDRVYAVLGMWPPSRGDPLTVDYSEGLEELERRTFRWLNSVHVGPNLLYRCRGIDLESDSSSWGFNTSPVENSHLDEAASMLHDTKAEPLYNAGKGTDFKIDALSTTAAIYTEAFVLSPISLVVGRQSPASRGLFSGYHDLDGQHLLAYHIYIDKWITENLSGIETQLTARDVWVTMAADQGPGPGERLSKSPHIQKSLDTFTDLLSANMVSAAVTELPNLSDNLLQQAEPYVNTQAGFSDYRLALSENNLVCLVPANTLANGNDYLCIISGTPVPHVVRRAGDQYRIVGSCYIHNMMDGQLFEQDPRPESQEIEII